ncbi:hypothetical protein BpHYR1_044676 [Brachionus plicatilis]|uniref:Uncharacterized protein n=1 Tax=Brachionus plicatilis TaxID=10195 RepID=A0A3M7T2A0_BRAPC|nr:hypothetical protein BpHYR1_044676 [Brachionus plicatilis]
MVALEPMRGSFVFGKTMGKSAHMRGSLSEPWLPTTSSAYVVAGIAAGYSRKIQVAISGNESFSALLDFLGQNIKEPNVVYVFGVLVVVETVDDRLAEASGNYFGSLALFKAV